MHASVIEYHMTNVKEECNSSFSGIDHDVLQACKKEKRKRKRKKKIFLRFLPISISR
jgi:tRNA A37 threonylcarbamoyltransferase TsaD